jgi:hypothetical protein
MRDPASPPSKWASRRLSFRDRRKNLWLEVAYRGGPEALWVVRCRGGEWLVPGHRAIEDVMAHLNGER